MCCSMVVVDNPQTVLTGRSNGSNAKGVREARLEEENEEEPDERPASASHRMFT